MRAALSLPVRRVRALADAYSWRPPRVRTVRTQTHPPCAYFLVPDQDTPSGGTRTTYRHVDLLQAAGVPATVLHHHPGFRCTWFPHTTPVTDVRSARLGPDDLLVVAEIYATLLPLLPDDLRHVVFNQSGHLTWERAPETVHAHYASADALLAVVTVSEHSRQLLQFAYPHLSVDRVHQSLDPAMLHPGEGVRPRRITYLDRARGSREIRQVLGLLHDRGVLTGWEIRPLAGLAPPVLADELRRSRVFLSSVYQEGFGLPAAEAMACGNLVVGFDGFGGREFLRPPYARPVPTGDVLAFAQVLEHVLRDERQDQGRCQREGLLASAQVLAAYRPAQELDDVLRIYRPLLDRSSEVRGR